MRRHWQRSDGNLVEVAVTTRVDGDFHIDAEPEALAARRDSVLAGPWSVVRQVHGSTVVEADPASTPEADGIFTDVVGRVIGVQGADCSPIAFITSEGPIGVVHAGWRGLAAGVIGQMATTLTDRGAAIERIVVGPTICVDCYEFGAEDLDMVAAALGEAVRATTPSGTPALDLMAGIELSCEAHGLGPIEALGGCTSCNADEFFSHRARQEPQRHALAMRITTPTADGA